MTIPREIDGSLLPRVIASISHEFTKERITPSEHQPENQSSESPIFILSSGWRSGSTAAQRLFCSDPATIIWGEPFGESIPICRLAKTLEAFDDGRTHKQQQIKSDTKELNASWIANLNPGLSPLLNAHRAFFNEGFAKPAYERGYKRWGLKLVRVSGDYIDYLQLLYPKAKFLLLFRDPTSSYESYKSKRWFTIYPSHQVNTLNRFICHWNHIATSFLKHKSRRNVLIADYRYFFTCEKTMRTLSHSFELNLPDNFRLNKVGVRKRKKKLSFAEKILIRHKTSGILAELTHAAEICRQQLPDGSQQEPAKSNSNID